MTTQISQPGSKTASGENRKRGILRWALKMTVGLLLFGTVLFLAAGRIDWAPGWVYLAMNALTQLLSALVLIPRQPEMLAERSKVQAGTKSWDRVLAPLIVIVGTLAVLVTAGLDARFRWTPAVLPVWWVLGIVLAFGSQMFVLWAMASNPFFSGTVRIQEDRGQMVTRSGPYQLVRHPGYAGALIYNLAIPLVLNSWWTYIPAVFTIILLVIRTALEDRTLQAELPGYAEYARQVRYRLVPKIW